MSFDMDIAIFITFLIMNLIFGLFASRDINNIKEYAIGNRNFSTAAITATIVATWLFGSVISLNLAETYNNGLYFIIPGIADGISFFIVAYFYAPRMKEFIGQLSVAEAMGSLYGKQVRMITAIFALIPAIGNIAVQFSIWAILLKYLFGGLNIYILVASSLMVITYSTLGGIKSVTFTDMIQFFTFGVVVPMMVFLIWKQINNTEAISDVFTSNPLFDYKEVMNINNSRFLNALLLFLFFMIPGIDPALFQRIAMAKNTAQISRSFIVAGSIITCFYILVDFAGVLLIADKVTDINQNNVLQYIFNHYLSSGFRGLFIIGIMAMIMSTADSYINSSAILFAYDSIKVIGIELTEKKQLFVVRITALVIGILALLLSLLLNNLLELILSTYSFYMPIVSVPLILAIFGFRSTSRSVVIGMTAGFVTVIYFKFLSEIDSIIPGMLSNLIFFIGSHYILGEQGGWVSVKDRASIDTVRLKRKRRVHNFVELVKGFSLVKFSQNNTPKEERIFVYFGLFCIVTIFSHAYSLPKNLPEQYEFILNPIYYSVLILSIIFITYPIWLKEFKNAVFISLLWNIAVFYNLVFCNCLLSIIGQFNQIQVMVLMTSLITITILIRWQVTTLMIISGIAITIILHKIFIDANIPDYMGSLQFKMFYSLLLLSSVLIIFLKPKQEHQELTELKNAFLFNKNISQKRELIKLHAFKNELLQNLEHEAHTPITGITSMGQILDESYDKLTEQQRRIAIKDIAKSSERLTSLVNNLINLSKLESLNYKLNKTQINLSRLLYKRLELCRKLYIEQEKQNNLTFDLDIEDKTIILCDEYYVTCAIDNIIINAIQYTSQGKISIKLFRNQHEEVEFSVKDEGIGIPKEELFDIFGTFIVSSKTKTYAGGRGVGLALSKKVIDLHKGRIWAKQNPDKGVTFTFTLPV